VRDSVVEAIRADAEPEAAAAPDAVLLVRHAEP